MYKVIVQFADLKDNEHVYSVGDEYPRKGYNASKERVEELSTKANALNQPLIELVKETKKGKK